MPAILLNHANLAHIKVQLKPTFANVKSSHVVEAVAAGLSFNTYAAMRVFIANDDSDYPAVRTFDATLFGLRLAVLGYGADIKREALDKSLQALV